MCSAAVRMNLFATLSLMSAPISSVFGATLTTRAALRQDASGGRVAVFAAANFPYYGGSHSLSPNQVASDLRSAGIDARLLSSADLADPALFNRRRYAMMVNVYGNTFPLPAYANLRRFHLAGGGIVSTGVPFTHPCDNASAAGWDASPEWGPDVYVERNNGVSTAVIRGQDEGWRGIESIRVPARPGESLRVSGTGLVRGPAAGQDNLYVRFWDRGGDFLGQQGPVFRAASVPTTFSMNVTAPARTAAVDVSPQVRTNGVTVRLTGVSLRRGRASLIPNGDFRKPGAGWRDLGHTSDYLGEEGMGMGGFGGPDPASHTRLDPGNPLELPSTHAAFLQGLQPQFLDPHTLPQKDTILPVVTTFGAHGTALGYPAALIVHHDAFAGAVDGWTGPYAVSDAPAVFFLRQTLEREVVVAMRLENAISASVEKHALGQLSRQVAPPPPPHDLPIPRERRPYSTFFPVSPSLSRHLLVADVRALSREDKLLLTSLQGLVNRRQPRIWLLFGPDDVRWLKWLQQEGDTGAPVSVTNPMSLLSRFRSEFHDAVIPDPARYMSVDIAADISGARSLLIATPEQCRRYRLHPRADLRGRFATDAASLEWVSKVLYPHLSHFLLMAAHPDLAYNGSFDYMIQHRGIVFWMSGDKDGVGLGRNSAAEQAVVERLFAKMPINIPVRGFWWHGEGVGVGEGPGVTLGSRYGKVSVVSDGMTNISVESGVHVDHLVQKPRAPAPPLDRAKVYYALTMSDGDNLDTHFGYFASYVESPLHGKIPVGWGMGPTLIDLAPAVARWYYKKATPADEYVCDVSGVGYMYPSSFGTAYRDRKAVMDDFLAWTARYVRRMDQRTVREMGVETSQIPTYAAHVPGLDSLIPDYGHQDDLRYPQLTYSLPNGLPVFRAATNGQAGVEQRVAQVQQTVGARRPAFLNFFIWNWGFHMPELERITKLLGPNFVPVTPHQLAQLYEESRKAR